MNIRLTKYSGASDDAIKQAEDELRVSFPADYRSFVNQFDGATLEVNSFGGDARFSVDRFIPISEIKARSGMIEGFPKDAFPIAEAPSGNFIYMKQNDFSVWYWDHELEAGDFKLSPSFDEFLCELQRFDIESIQLRPGQVKSVWVDPDFTPEF